MILANKRVEDLQPYLQHLYKQLVEECKKVGIELCLIETRRSQERQNEIFKAGTGPKLIGPHGAGLAFDIAPLKDGKIPWKDGKELFNKVGEIGKRLGLEWGGDWKGVDCPHFQFVGGLSDAEIRAGKLPKFPPIPGKEELSIMSYKLAPIAKGVLKGTSSLTCCSKPSNNARTQSVLKKGIHEPISIYAKCSAEGIEWYLVNPVNEQWVAAHYIQII